MKKNDNIISLEKARKEKEGKDSIIPFLKDTRKVARAIQSRTCLFCHVNKMCVNKTGLCATCYSDLASSEKRVADKEAEHKIIQVNVIDDRWKKKKEK
jgi:hypothetical protein